jgi:tyrosinase
MESRVHDTIPFGIGANFETFTAPYDPLFYPHHTQLDRL